MEELLPDSSLHCDYLRGMADSLLHSTSDNGKKKGLLAQRRITGPDARTVYGNRGYPLRVEQHRVTASRRELILREQFANPHKHQASICRSDEPHPAKSNSGVAVGIVGEDDLIGRQRHFDTVREENEGAWWAVSDDRKRRNAVLLQKE